MRKNNNHFCCVLRPACIFYVRVIVGIKVANLDCKWYCRIQEIHHSYLFNRILLHLLKMHNLRSDLVTAVVLFSFLVLSALGWMLSILVLQRINDLKCRNLGRILNQKVSNYFSSMLQSFMARLFKVSWKQKSSTVRRAYTIESVPFFSIVSNPRFSNLGSCFDIHSRSNGDCDEDWTQKLWISNSFKLLSTIWTGKLLSKRSEQRSSASDCKCRKLESSTGIDRQCHSVSPVNLSIRATIAGRAKYSSEFPSISSSMIFDHHRQRYISNYLRQKKWRSYWSS